MSALLTRLAIAYALRRRLIDHPGARRSHEVPTPRGGGIGIVVAVLAFAVIPALFAPGLSHISSACLGIALAIVALGGWIDDHGGLAALWRFLAHCLAATIFLLPILVPLLLMPSAIESLFSVSAGAVWAIAGISIVAIVWSINLHNFMDGIDGILAAQAIFVFAALAVLAFRAGSVHAGQVVVFAAAAAGFLPFNFPRARIFMGDVGSGVVGLLIAVAVIWQIASSGTALASGLILCSAFAVDASCTLASRVLRGRRWYHAHREHLYQWLARSGGSHARVVALYMGWNLLIAAPVVFWINRPGDGDAHGHTAWWLVDSGLAAAIAVYVSGVALWIAGKRWCLARAEHPERSRHA